MPTVGVCGRKGGSGKTTTAVHLAAEFATRGLSVALVDCDTQGSAAYWGHPGKLPMQVFHWTLERVEEASAWKKRIRALPVDFLILDSPPHLEAALGAVIDLSDIAVIPCGPSGLDLIATAQTVALVRQIRGDSNKPLISLVPSRVDHRTASGRDLHAALVDLGEDVTPDIHNRTVLADAFNLGEWVGAYAPQSPAHLEVQALADHVLSRLGEPQKKRGHKR